MAYIRLCKQFHPDLNQLSTDPKLQELNKIKIQDINKAYNCLIKDDQRLAYDQYIRQNIWTNVEINRYQKHSNSKPNDKQKSYESTDDFSGYYDHIRDRQYKDIFSGRYRHYRYRDDNRYYGFKNIKKVSNARIVFICVYIVFFGFLLHSLQYKYTLFTLNRMNDKWKDNGIEYQRIRYNSRLNTNEENIKLFKSLENRENKTSIDTKTQI